MGKHSKPARKGSRRSHLKFFDTFAECPYARFGTNVTGLSNKPGQRIPKAGFYVEAGAGSSSTEFGIFDVTARGPNISMAAEASVDQVTAVAKTDFSATVGPLESKFVLGVGTKISAEDSDDEVDAIAKAEVSATVGPFQFKLGLGVDTGKSVGLNGLEFTFL